MIASMTGYARIQTSGDWGHANWEMRSVNHRFLELTLRLPESLRQWEMPLREKAKQYLQRGKVDINLQLQTSEKVSSDLQLNQNVLRQLVKGMQQIAAQITEYTPPQLMDILRWPDLLQSTGNNIQQYKQAIFDSFDQALDTFIHARQHEGEVLQALIEKRLETIQQEIEKISREWPAILQWQRDKLIARFEQAKIELDPLRLEQEMLFLAQKTDIAEEIERCQAHTQHFKDTLQSGQELGRRLNFLLQEMAREVNTLSVKSADIKITASTVNLKLLIEQIREQVQNIE